MLNGIGEKLERRLWRSGILTWEDFIGSPSIDFIPSGSKALHDGRLAAAGENLTGGNAEYFSEFLSGSEHWRLFKTFRDEAVCLDIETNGYQAERGGYPTVVGLYDGSAYRSFVWGRDLTTENLMEELSNYKYLITFYGSVFDVPFLEEFLPGFKVQIPHFDLCFGARRMGLNGGLKRLEEALGIERAEETRGMDGYDAVLLWQRARRGDGEAMALLLSYNREDTVNLMRIAETVYGGLRSSTGIEEFLG
jgi:uncharacterized protein YprB with RNaseH-like and TPR domain